jgi:hypothetical protein
MRAWLVIVLLLGGCTAREGAAWVPRLYVRGAVVHRVRVHEGAETWSWQVQGGARWSEAAVADVPPDEPSGAPPRGEREPSRCASEILCAWERRAREQTHREVLHHLGRRVGP